MITSTHFWVLDYGKVTATFDAAYRLADAITDAGGYAEVHRVSSGFGRPYLTSGYRVDEYVSERIDLSTSIGGYAL
jgi:hypothetical protein